MGWEFEHWDNGKVYLHKDRWEAFRANLHSHGSYPHNWDHNIIFFQLHSPRDVITEIPAPGDDPEKYTILDTDSSYSVIYEPYPAFVRTNEDPEGWLPSWHIFAEDKHKYPQESITILTTGDIYRHTGTLSLYLTISPIVKNKFAYFRGKLWRFENFQWFGIGPNPPPTFKKKRKKVGRSIHDPFEQSW